MFNKLIPANKKFFELLEKSASYLEQGAGVLVEAVENPARFRECAARLERLESEEDSVTHELLVLLDKSFITPIDREDIHELAQALDNCMDGMEAVTERMQLYGITEQTEPSRQLASLIRQQAMQVHAAVTIMPGFKYDKVIPHCKEIGKLENQADRVAREALVALFQRAGDPLQIMKWKDIYDYMETVTDKCEDVAGIVERIVLKHG
jgi:uncharacterized protein